MHLVFWRKNIASQGAVNFVMILIVIIRLLAEYAQGIIT